MSAQCEPAVRYNESTSCRGVKREPIPSVTESLSGPVCNRSSDATIVQEEPKLLRFQSYQVLQLDRRIKDSDTRSYINHVPKNNLIAIVGSSEAGRTRGKNDAQQYYAPECDLPVAHGHHFALIEGKVHINNVDLDNGRVDLTRHKDVRAVIVTDTKYENAEECGKRMRLALASYDSSTPEVGVPPVRQTGNIFHDPMTVHSAKPIPLPAALCNLGRYHYHITLRINARTHNEVAPKDACHEPFMFALGPQVPPLAQPAPWLRPCAIHYGFHSFTVVKKGEEIFDFGDKLNVLVTSSEGARQRNAKDGAHSQYQALAPTLPPSDLAHHLAIIETRALVRNHHVEHGRIEMRRDVKMTFAIISDLKYEDPQELGDNLCLMFARSPSMEFEVEVPNVRSLRDSYTPPLTVSPCKKNRKIPIPASVRSLGRHAYCFEVTIHARTHNELAPSDRRHEPFTFALASRPEPDDVMVNTCDVMVNTGNDIFCTRGGDGVAFDGLDDMDLVADLATCTAERSLEIDSTWIRPAPTHGRDIEVDEEGEDDDDDDITESTLPPFPAATSMNFGDVFKSELAAEDCDYSDAANTFLSMDVKPEPTATKCHFNPTHNPSALHPQDDEDEEVDGMVSEDRSPAIIPPPLTSLNFLDEMLSDSQEAYLFQRSEDNGTDYTDWSVVEVHSGVGSQN